MLDPLKLQLTGSHEPWTYVLGTELGSLEEQYLLLSHLQPEYVLCKASVLKYLPTLRCLGFTHFLTYPDLCNCIYCCEEMYTENG